VPYANLVSSQRLFANALGEYFGIHPDQVVPTAGTTGAIESVRNHVFKIAATKNPTVLTVSPGYWRARESLQGLGFEVIGVTTENNGFTIIESELVERAIEIKPELLYLSLPNNPTGAVFDPIEIIRGIPEQTAAMIDLTLPSGSSDARELVVSLYRNFAERKNLFLVGSMSKSHNMAEYRVGWAICTNVEDAADLRKENRNVIPTFSIEEALKRLGTRSIAREKIGQSFVLLKEGERHGNFEIVRPRRMSETAYVLIKSNVDAAGLKRTHAEKQIQVMWGSEFDLSDNYIRLETLEPSYVKIFVDAVNLYHDA
jgi:aspartate/methionine/tyrosine aminotransferase